MSTEHRVCLPEMVHDQDELAWATAGTGQVEIDGRAWWVTTSVGLWIPAGVRHRVTIEADSLIAPAFFTTAGNHHAQGAPLSWNAPTAVAVTSALRSRLQHRVQCEMAKVSISAETTDRTLEEIAALRLPEATVPMPSSPEALRVAEALLADPADQRTLGNWSRELYVGPKSLQRSFTAETGRRFTDWRTEVRLRAALPLLAAGHQVAHVSRAVGYASTGGFITAFRRHFGRPPGKHARGSVAVARHRSG